MTHSRRPRPGRSLMLPGGAPDGCSRPAFRCEYVVTDELGLPVHPEWYSDEFVRLLKRTGLPRITLHDSRHTTLTLMEHAGVPISIVSRGQGTTTRPSLRRPTCTPATTTCAKDGPRWPGFTRSLRTCEKL